MAEQNNVMKATLRASGSKGAARRVRRDGLVPGVVYGNGIVGLSVAFDVDDLERMLRTEHAYNAAFTLEVEGEGSHLVMVREIQFDSVRRAVTHIDFKVVRPDERVELEIPVVATGRSAGVALGGRLDIVRRTVKIATTVAHIPTEVTHDVTPLAIGDQVYIDEMNAPEGSSFVFNHRYPVIRVARRRGAKTEEEGENGESEE